MKVFFRYCLVGHVVATAFIFGETVVPHPRLSEIVDNHRTKRVALNIEVVGGGASIHQKNNNNNNDAAPPRFAIKDIVLDLHNAPVVVKKKKNKNDKPTALTTGDSSSIMTTADDWVEVVKMPGHDGDHPRISGGLRTLDVVQQGQFVNQDGLQNVETSKATWELVWMKDAHAGSLNIGFEVPKDYTRGGNSGADHHASSATLPKGPVYLNFFVWSKESLEYARTAKEKAFRIAKESLEERNEELTKMQETSNPFLKALHYRNAYAAIETYTLQPLKHYQEMVPDEGETIQIQEDVYLNARGKVWTKEMPRGPQFALGTAKLTLMSP
eukprot:CAMPEP_0117022940 /NCGR_PEP_ID=MMETSP0472-20121206/17178_1 /TAXON_ID=693140 ORGANISM="Tiarina fusus, Strain LIS" /NCGR_SAMPLE_ID=MMETSP0472 /ASSEMBLY_ACC=CAM_ASM_000603 /LENGTH=326 /DNA_ID=CAMNT_0004728927 /DNA_START=134 /DNA_END=1114 /DNA_ORIENTATION=-